MSLETFRQKIGDYCHFSGYSQKILAQEVGLHLSTLSHKLNGKGKARLTIGETKQIVKTLAGWQAFTTQTEVAALLELVNLKPSVFSEEEWKAPPFDKLEKLEQLLAPSKLSIALDAAVRQPKRRLPHPLTSLIGRQAEVTLICDLMTLNEVRLLTLTGPGGVGKTRLAIAAAEPLQPDYEDQIYFVELAPIVEAARFVPALIAALGLQESGQLPLFEIVKRFFQTKKALLVLDNFEQIVAAAPLLGELLEASPQLKILVTSRILLHIYGEYEFRVQPLALPQLEAGQTLEAAQFQNLLEYPALALFAERAQAIKYDFILSEANVQTVAEICNRLDGLPLAVELAAARIKLFTPGVLLDRLVQEPEKMPLQVLNSQARNVPPRQQNLRNTIEWSYNLLEAHEQRIFSRLAVFVGGFTTEAAAAILESADVSEALETLIDQSLLENRESASGETRFILLQTIREYGLERLEQSEEARAVHQLHARYYLQLVAEAEGKLRRSHQSSWWQQLEREYSNLRAALQWAIDNCEGDLLLEAGYGIWWFWWVRSYLNEANYWMEKIVERSRPTNTTQENSCLPLLVYVHTITGQAGFAAVSGNSAQAQALFAESLQIYRTSIPNDNRGLADSLHGLGLMALDRGELKQAQTFFSEDLALQQEMGEKEGEADALRNLGLVALLQQDFDQAENLFKKALGLAEELGDQWGVAHLYNRLGWTAMGKGQVETAQKRGRDAIAQYIQLGDRRNIAENLELLACSFGGLAQFSKLAELHGAAHALREAIGMPLRSAFAHLYQVSIQTAKKSLGEEAFQQAWTTGLNKPLEKVITEIPVSLN